ncbi:MAG: aminotransferase class I/II-fold pyridoxal phosphate-dependent enzyme [Chitinophagales bacterium]|nr:aminotransferase class I/II-fold pyridoxal phosphate-dependent enzyme [Chitinophagales bacterium]
MGHSQELGFDSLCIKDPEIDGLNSHLPPIYATSTFVYGDLDKALAYFQGNSDAYVYSRLGNPSVNSVAEKIAALEAFGLLDEQGQPLKAYGQLFGSGMGAIAAATAGILTSGDKILTQGNLYGTTNELFMNMLPNFGIECIIANLKDLEHIENALINDEKIQLIYIETPANPTLACFDIEAITVIAQNFGVKVVVDNTFATPYLQQPLKYGVDLVVHSSTKYLNGHGTGLTGAVIGSQPALVNVAVKNMQKMFGACASPFEAYLLNNGIKTLALRMERHCDNAEKLAYFLETSPRVDKVNYLSLDNHLDHALAKDQMKRFGGMLSFEVKGGREAALNFLRNLKFCTLTASLGTPDTLVQHPATMSHVKMLPEQRLQYGITDGLIRVSVGLENIEDIVNDFDQALG